MKRVLFLCVENSCRSQIAEAYARKYGKDVIEAFSAGSHPSGKINENAILSMHEIGYDLRQHSSKTVADLPEQEFEWVITMGCGDACPYLPARHRDDWAIPDPKNLPLNEFRKIRAMIEERVKLLIQSLAAPDSGTM